VPFFQNRLAPFPCATRNHKLSGETGFRVRTYEPRAKEEFKSYDGDGGNASEAGYGRGFSGFAENCVQWDNKSMTKQTLLLIGTLAIGLASSDALLAQQTPSGSSQTPAATTPAKPATAAKTGTSGQASTGAKSATGAKKPATAATAVPLKTQKEKGSYSIGLRIGGGLKKDGVDLDAASLSRGIRDALSGAKPLLTDQEAQAALTVMATEVRAKQQAKLAAVSTANKLQGDTFLAGNKTKDGVVTLPSGLQYKVLTAGTGPKPAPTDKVTCNYRGTLVEGKEFDSSYKRGEPVTFGVGEVIKGWSEALQLMPVGSKWQLFVPPDLAYGAQGAGQDIGPNSTLVFEVELISIAPKTDAKTDVKPPDSK
jgi:FKBP-type peptidyl-prolyl cis-trans isomerase